MISVVVALWAIVVILLFICGAIVDFNRCVRKSSDATRAALEQIANELRANGNRKLTD